MAILPPEPILSEVKAFKNDLAEKYGTRTALRSPAHITLYMPFHRREDEEAALSATLASFGAAYQAFDIHLDGFDCFEPRVLFIHPEENSSLQNIQSDLKTVLKEKLGIFNARFYHQTFHPHMTIANRDWEEAQFYQAWEEFKNKVYQRTFSAQTISLLRLGENRWEILQEFALASSLA